MKCRFNKFVGSPWLYGEATLRYVKMQRLVCAQVAAILAMVHTNKRQIIYFNTRNVHLLLFVQ